MSKPLPGPYGIPVFGSLLSLVNFKERTLMKWGEIYGPVYEVKMGSWRAVVLNTYEAVKEAFVDKDEAFSDRPIMDLMRSYRGLNGKEPQGLLFTSDHSDCQKWKKFLVASFPQIWSNIKRGISLESKKLIEHIDQQKDGTLDIGEFIAHGAANVLLQMCFSLRYDHDEPEILDLINLIYDTPRDGRFGLMVFMPWLKVLPANYRFLREVEGRHAKLLEYFRKLLQARKPEVTSSPPRDLSAVFHQAYPDGADCDVNYFLTVIEDMFFGGTLPVKSQFMWILLLLLKNPSYVKRAQDEIDRVFGNCNKESGDDDVLHDDDIFTHLHLTRAIIQEGIRLRPAVPTGNFHCTKHETEFQDFKIAGNMLVIPNIWSVHHDPIHWKPDPNAYRPERHLDSNGHFKSSTHVIPFSVGRRKCAGGKMALRQLGVFLIQILRTFNVELHERHLTDIDGESVALYVPKPYKIKLTRRNK